MVTWVTSPRVMSQALVLIDINGYIILASPFQLQSRWHEGNQVE